MKRYLKEIIILLLQLIIFYVLPIRIGNIGALGMVFLLLLTTFILSIVVGCILKSEFKYLYPIIAALLFIPTIWIYYNESALIHSIWYLCDGYIGVFIGTVINKITTKGAN